MKLTTTVEFKSDRFVYYKEKNGIKNNTTRIVSQKEDDLLKNKSNHIKYIKIISTFYFFDGLPSSFTRTIKDITRYVKDDIIIYIFTWEV
jgi:hypothetical protein